MQNEKKKKKRKYIYMYSQTLYNPQRRFSLKQYKKFLWLLWKTLCTAIFKKNIWTYQCIKWLTRHIYRFSHTSVHLFKKGNCLRHIVLFVHVQKNTFYFANVKLNWIFFFSQLKKKKILFFEWKNTIIMKSL